jgi:uncharacterized protein (TIGR02147 family)
LVNYLEINLAIPVSFLGTTMNLYAENDYRKIIAGLVEERRELDKQTSFQSVAEFARMPKSYLSKVIHGTADLNADQLYLIAKYFDLSEDEQRYLEQLLDYARCGLEDRRKILLKRIRSVQNERLDARYHLKANLAKTDDSVASEYYLDPIVQIVHICLAVPRFQTDLKILASALHIPLARVIGAIAVLERLGIVERKNQKYKILVDSLHLPTDSALFHSWLFQLRSMALQRQHYVRDKSNYEFSVVFSADEDVQQSIRRRFLDFVKETQQECGKARDAQVFQMNFDLLSWA